jgi:hypothetical protein
VRHVGAVREVDGLSQLPDERQALVNAELPAVSLDETIQGDLAGAGIEEQRRAKLTVDDVQRAHDAGMIQPPSNAKLPPGGRPDRRRPVLRRVGRQRVQPQHSLEARLGGVLRGVVHPEWPISQLVAQQVSAHHPGTTASDSLDLQQIPQLLRRLAVDQPGRVCWVDSEQPLDDPSQPGIGRPAISSVDMRR